MSSLLHKLFRRAKSGDPVHRVADTENLNFVYSVLEDIQGVGCSIEKPTDAGGKGWRIVFDGKKSDEQPAGDLPAIDHRADSDVSGKKFAARLTESLDARYYYAASGDSRMRRELSLFDFLGGGPGGSGLGQEIAHLAESGETDAPICEFPLYPENLWFIVRNPSGQGAMDGPSLDYWPADEVLCGFMQVDDASVERKTYGGYSGGLPILPKALRIKNFHDPESGKISAGDLALMRANILDYVNYSGYLSIFDEVIREKVLSQIDEEYVFLKIGQLIDAAWLDFDPLSGLKAATCSESGRMWGWTGAPGTPSPGSGGLFPAMKSAVASAASAFSSYAEDELEWHEKFTFFSSHLSEYYLKWSGESEEVSAAESSLQECRRQFSALVDDLSALEDAIYNSADARSVDIDDRISALEAQV